MNDLTIKQQIKHTISTLPDSMLIYLQKKLHQEFDLRAIVKSNKSHKLEVSAKSGSNKRCIKQHIKAQHNKIRSKNENNPRYYNSNNLVSLRAINDPLHVRRSYFKALIKQDWSSVYPENIESTDLTKFYVYAHVNPNKFSLHTGSSGAAFIGTPFYIGKGTGNRAFDLNRNQGHGKELNTYLSYGHDKKDIVNIVYTNLTNNKALEIEAKLIYFFGTIYQKNRHNTFLYNLDIPTVPEFIGTMLKYTKQ